MSAQPIEVVLEMGKILIVDDEAAFRRSIAEALRRNGHETLEAGNTGDGLQLAMDQNPELIISDICMAQGDGLTFLKNVRSNPNTAAIPFLVMTGQPNFEGMVTGAENAADAYLPKPFSLHTLLATVASRLDREKILRRGAEEIKGQLQRILEASPDLIGIIEPATLHFLFLNIAGRKMLAVPENADISRKRFVDFLPPDSADHLAGNTIPRVLKEGIWAGESVLVSEFGRHIPVKQFLQAHSDSNGQLAYISTIAHDLTDDKVAEAALRASEKRFRSLIDSLPDAGLMHDKSGRVVFCNAPTELIFGYSSAELQTREIKSLFSSQEFDFQKKRAPHSKEVACVRKNGESFPADVILNILEVGGERVGLSIVRDLSERTRLEKERQIMEVQLRQALKLESIGQLAAGIAHEINTPTQYIGDNARFLQDGFASLAKILPHYDELIAIVKEKGIAPELLQSIEAAKTEADLDYLVEEIPRAIQQSLEGVERVTRLVRAMKDFSHPGVSEKTAIDINHAIDSTITVARNEWKYVANMVVQFDPDLPHVPCLPAELNQVILNLIVNAAHAIGDVVGEGDHEKGTITVSTARRENSVEIQIEDTGSGIPEEVRNRIFEPFFTTKEVGRGTGQGLAIARSVVVDKHGGTIRFETAMGKGTAFIVTLPLNPAPPPGPS
jgi:PAS domain S-box-containing protein